MSHCPTGDRGGHLIKIELKNVTEGVDTSMRRVKKVMDSGEQQSLW